jgi:hypothetical protein
MIFFTAFTIIGQVATVTMNTLCRTQYCIYDATLYATYLQLIFTSNFHTHSNVTFHPFVNK